LPLPSDSSELDSSEWPALRPAPALPSLQELSDGIRAIIRPPPPVILTAADPTLWYAQQLHDDQLDQQAGPALVTPPPAAADSDWASVDAEYAELLEEQLRRMRVARLLAQLADPQPAEVQCIICTLPLHALTTDAPCTLQCHASHAFHAGCLHRFWAAAPRKSCPICRSAPSLADDRFVSACARRATACVVADRAVTADVARQLVWDALPPAPSSAPISPPLQPPPLP